MPKRTRDYHEFLLEQLTDPIFAAEYLNEARQDSQKMFLKALRNVAESRRMAVVAIEAGVNRESLYKSLSEDGNPRLATYDSILSALDLDYVIKPKQVAVPGSSEPSPETKESEEVAPVRINLKTGNTLQSAEWAFNPDTLIASGIRNYQDTQDAAMPGMPQAFMIAGNSGGEGLLQEQAGGAN